MHANRENRDRTAVAVVSRVDDVLVVCTDCDMFDDMQRVERFDNVFTTSDAAVVRHQSGFRVRWRQSRRLGLHLLGPSQ